ncbi:Hypothetical protein A7982_05272 [Minicystis rosea]|nr:Hypothetical protein A7982_05272 [Minicystis rosea]
MGSMIQHGPHEMQLAQVRRSCTSFIGQAKPPRTARESR